MRRLLSTSLAAFVASSALGQDGGGEPKPAETAPALFAGTAEDLAGAHANVSVRSIGTSLGRRPLVVVSVLPTDEREDTIEWEAFGVGSRKTSSTLWWRSRTPTHVP